MLIIIRGYTCKNTPKKVVPDRSSVSWRAQQEAWCWSTANIWSFFPFTVWANTSTWNLVSQPAVSVFGTQLVLRLWIENVSWLKRLTPPRSGSVHTADARLFLVPVHSEVSDVLHVSSINSILTFQCSRCRNAHLKCEQTVKKNTFLWQLSNYLAYCLQIWLSGRQTWCSLQL